MSQLLSRGYEIGKENRIKKMIASGDDWQIYSTNYGTYCLVVSKKLYDIWIKEYAVPNTIFDLELLPGYALLIGKNEYLISSISEGPFPCDYQQIEGFSIAFNTALKIFPNTDMSSSIFIEEYSMILPTKFEKIDYPLTNIYGKWITGGVNVSIESTERILELTSWLPREAIEYAADIAGFKIDNVFSNQEVSNNYIEKEKFKLIGRPYLEEFFNDNIIDIVLNQKEYERMGISFPGATILYGPPGCGKTYAIEKLSEYLEWPRFDINSNSIASPYIHDTSKKISEVFDSAIKSAPSIIVIDEMEAFLSDRATSNNTGTHHVEEVAEFLRKIPEAISKNVLVFAMTNMIDSVDSAIRRRGRFDYIIEVKMPSAEEIKCLLENKFKELPIGEDVEIESISKALENHPMSDVAYILREAGRIAVKSGKKKIDKLCFDKSIESLPIEKKEIKIGF